MTAKKNDLVEQEIVKSADPSKEPCPYCGEARGKWLARNCWNTHVHWCYSCHRGFLVLLEEPGKKQEVAKPTMAEEMKSWRTQQAEKKTKRKSRSRKAKAR